jgi:hypothetical protein
LVNALAMWDHAEKSLGLELDARSIAYVEAVAGARER